MEEAPTQQFQFASLRGETLIKNPGSINGESFVLRDLEDCTVFLLDYTSEVEVSNCINCQIFIGPVDGPAIFDACTSCRVAVACQQFQAKGCTSCSFSLYCATGPSLSGCSDITVACWGGAYAGLPAHFAAASLDPTKNQWNKVYDASAPPAGEGANFTLIEGAPEPWVVEVEGGAGPAENPVPPPAALAPALAPAPVDPEPVVETVEEVLEVVPEPVLAADPFPADANGDAPMTDPMEPSEPATAEARDALSARLASQAREEAEKRAATQSAAAAYLERFYAERNAAKDKRIAAGRDELAARGSGEVGPTGSSVWERAISMLDFAAARPGGGDLSRFKAVLFACKERGA